MLSKIAKLLLPGWFKRRLIKKELRAGKDGRGGSITTDNVDQLKDWLDRKARY